MKRSMEKTTPRCPTCKLGFINFGRLSAVHRFEDHLNQAHNIRCFECDLSFSSQTHLHFHTRYQHDNHCAHCNSFCNERCSEMLGVSLSKSQENKEAKAERISSLEEEISHEVQKKIQQNVEFIDALEAIATMMDRGYSDISLTEVCSMAYLPTRRTPRFPINSTKNQVDAWVTSESYETALDKLSEEAKGVKILRCKTEKTCGFFFFSEKQAESHFWSMHQGQVNPNMDQAGKSNKNTVMKATSDINHVEKAE